MTAEPTPIFQGIRVTPIHVRGRLLTQSVIHDSGLHIRFQVERLRNAPAGVHGKAGVYVIEADGTQNFLASDNFNIERSEDRRRLADRAYKRLGSAGEAAFSNAEQFGVLFDSFCVDAWPASVNAFSGGWVTPSAAITPVDTLTPFIVREGGTIMFAPPGSAKTFIGLVVAYSVQYGLSNLWPVKQVPALYVNLERSEESMRRRLLMVCKALGLPSESPLLMLNRRGASIADVEDAISEMVREYNVGLVIVDSLSRFGGGGSLKDDDTMNTAMDLMNRVAPTWLLIAHAPRQDSTHAFGSVMQDAAADVMLQVASEETQNHTLGISLNVSKANDIPRGHVGTYAFLFDREYGLTGIRPAHSGEFVVLEGAEEERLPLIQRVEAVLRRVGKMSSTDIAGELGAQRPAVARVLGNRNRFQKLGKDGRSQLYALIDSDHEDEI